MFDNHFVFEIVATTVTILIYLMVRFLTAKIIRRFAKVSEIIDVRRTNLVIKYQQAIQTTIGLRPINRLII